jgi:hypothetical protein
MNRYRITLKKEQLAVLEIDHELRPEFAVMLIARMLRDAMGDVWMVKDPHRPVAFETSSDWSVEKLVRVRNQWGEYRTFVFEKEGEA